MWQQGEELIDRVIVKKAVKRKKKYVSVLKINR